MWGVNLINVSIDIGLCIKWNNFFYDTTAVLVPRLRF